MEKQLYDAFLKASCVSSSCNNWTGSHSKSHTNLFPSRLPAVTQWKMWKSVDGKTLKLVFDMWHVKLNYSGFPPRSKNMPVMFIVEV